MSPHCRPSDISSPAATAFDLIRYSGRLGGIERTVETLGPIIPLIRVSDLKAVLNSEDEVSTTQRLGYLLETAGNSELADVVQGWLPTGLDLIPLASSKEADTDLVIQRWRILNNAKVQFDS